jgi:hypothetical protein
MNRINWKDKTQVCDYAKKLAGRCDTTMVVYKHPNRFNYNITHLSTFERHGHDKSWIVMRVPPTRRYS